MLTATAQRVGESLAYEVDVNGRHTLVTDEPVDLGGDDSGPAPHELLPAALASCIGTMIAMYAKRRDWDLGRVRVDVAYDPDANPRSCTVVAHLEGNLSAEQRKHLERVAETCPYRRALEAGFTFEEQLVIEPRDRAMAESR